MLHAVRPDEGRSAAEIVEARGLGWRVDQHPLDAVGSGPDGAETRRRVPRFVANVRSDSGAVLGVVGQGYRPLQNRDAFALADGLIDSGRAHWLAAGSTHGGARIHALLRLDRDVRPVGCRCPAPPGPAVEASANPPRASATRGSVDEAGRRRTALVSIVAALLLVLLKLGTGLVAGSLALVSAGIESSGDVVAALLTLLAVRLAGRPADREHPYGHRRAENLATLGEAAILAGGGVVIVVEALGRLIGDDRPPDARWYVFVVLAVAVLVDVSRMLVSLRTARRYGSAALRSNAVHFGADTLGTLTVLGGLLFVRAGVPEGDPVAALVVAVVIFAAAARLVRENAGVLMDRTPAGPRDTALAAVRGLEPDVELRGLRLRESGGRYFADVVVGVPPGRAVAEAHETAGAVEAAVQRALPGSDVVVHVEPTERGLDLRDRVLAVALAEPLVREAHDIRVFDHDGKASVSLHLKLPADLPLAEAHAVSERVERRLRADGRIADVETHLEPLEQVAATQAPGSWTAQQADHLWAVVHGRTGRDPRRLRILTTAAGVVVFLAVEVPAGASLAAAHDLAGRVEEAVRREVPEIAEVVVHTEPAPPHGAAGTTPHGRGAP